MKKRRRKMLIDEGLIHLLENVCLRAHKDQYLWMSRDSKVNVVASSSVPNFYFALAHVFDWIALRLASDNFFNRIYFSHGFQINVATNLVKITKIINNN